MKIGLDVGSTTIKCVVIDDNDQIIYKSYNRHYSHIVESAAKELERLRETVDGVVSLSVSGSAGLGFATHCGLPFVQEVFATRIAVGKLHPESDVVIELGGEDAKILFLTGGLEARMNGSCAGGTGAFIDQMATLLKTDPAGMDEAAKNSTRSYTIASRCGVFAKSDIQPLLNQGAKIEDVSVSIFQAVVNQTIAGLAQGRPIKGNVLYLGGPITFLSQLRACFDRTLGIEGTLPEDSLYYVAMGAAMYGQGECTLDEAISALEQYSANADYNAEAPLFTDEEEYEEFIARHASATAPRGELKNCDGPVYIGVDAGSTTVKVADIDGEGTQLYSDYRSNSGNPISIVKEVLEDIYRRKPDIFIAACAATGYGEEIVKNAFSLDMGVVETMAHFTAAKHFMPEVDFVIDIGGQDMKCFKIEKGAVSDIYLNEACSSGCGSFLQTFAEALGYTAPEFAKLGLKADRPVDLGSRCTVFMNSSVKQAQKDGASIENISAGLSMSVVKNAIYKVIRAASPEELGRHIVVQGGTFLNEAVLRAFEKEMGVPVVRPDIAGLMGAYGAALWAMDKGPKHSSVITAEGLDRFSYEMKQSVCGGCGNKCRLTISTFEGGKRFISGNRCERPVKGHSDDELNMMDFKRRLLASYAPVPGPRGRIGIPMGLNMYELLPFWHAFFTKLGFEVVTSPKSDRTLYLSGQDTI
ncbi:MAG: 2-hydroxyglutaryl-CoA dehydratase, partial [Oscillospiraceae bacterium]|nr:2-hydroxyglutaryl-CoA dehydratase [Oscillospiraceae bacterium]